MSMMPGRADDTNASTDQPYSLDYLKRPGIPAPTPEDVRRSLATSGAAMPAAAPAILPMDTNLTPDYLKQPGIAAPTPEQVRRAMTAASPAAVPPAIASAPVMVQEPRISSEVPPAQTEAPTIEPPKATDDQIAKMATPIAGAQAAAKDLAPGVTTTPAVAQATPSAVVATPPHDLGTVVMPPPQQQVAAMENAAPLAAATPIQNPPAPDPVRKQAVAPVPNPASVSTPPGAPTPSPPDTSPDETYSDQKATAFLRSMAGTGGVMLNVVDATSPADIQEPLHLDEAVAFALKNNFEVLAANEKTNGSYWDKMGAYAQYIPSVQLEDDTGPERSQPASINDANGNRVMDNTHNRRDRAITINQPIIDLGIISDILEGHDKKDLADEDERDVREGVAYDTVSIYLSLMQSRIAIRLADDYKGYLDRLAERMRQRVAGGGAANADLDRIQGRASAADSARIEALGEYQTNLTEFRRLTRVMPAQLVIPDVLAPDVPATIQEALERSLQSNPSYRSSLKKIDIAEDDRNKAFSGLIPKLSGQYTNSYTFNAGGSAEGNPVDGIYPTQKTQQVLLVAQWDLGGTSVTGGMSGMAKVREMNLRSLDARSRIEQAVQASYTAINAAHQREATLQKTVGSNERVVTGFEDQFQNGSRSLFDLLDAYEQLYNARLNLVRVTVANAKATYQIRRQMGQLVPSILGSEKR